MEKIAVVHTLYPLIKINISSNLGNKALIFVFILLEGYCKFKLEVFMWGADLISGITSKLPIIGKKEEPEEVTYSCPYACPLQEQPKEEDKSLFDFEMPTLSLPDFSLPSLSDILGSKTEAEKRAEKYPNVQWTGDEALDAKLAASIDLLMEKDGYLPSGFEKYGDIGKNEIVKAVKEDKIRVMDIPTSQGGYHYPNGQYEGYINVSLNQLQNTPLGLMTVILDHESTHSLQVENLDDDLEEAQAYYNGNILERKLEEEDPMLFKDSNNQTWHTSTYDTFLDSYEKGWSPWGLYDTGIQAFGLYKDRVIEDLKNNISQSTYYHPELKQETNS